MSFALTGGTRSIRLSAFFIVLLSLIAPIALISPAQAENTWADAAPKASDIVVPDSATLTQLAQTDGGSIVNGATHRAIVNFYGFDKERLVADSSLSQEEQDAQNASWNQTLISGDTVLQPAVPPVIDDYVFSHWALDDGTEGWESKRFDFSTPQTFDDSVTQFNIYAQYERQYVIGFIVRGSDYGASMDRVVGSYAETRECDSDGNFLNTTEGIQDRLTCTFRDYEKDIRPFLGAGKYVDGWTRSRDEYNDYVQGDEVVGTHANFYATIKEGYPLIFDSRGGSAVATAYGSPVMAPTKPTDPVRTGYMFKGWSSDPDTYTEYDFSLPLSQETTVYAFWEPAATTVHFEMMVEDTVGTDGNTLPLAWNAFAFTNPSTASSCTSEETCKSTNPLIIVASSENGLPEGGATDGTDDFTAAMARTQAVADSREGAYRLQGSQTVSGYKTGNKPEGDALAPIQNLCAVPESMSEAFTAELMIPSDEDYVQNGLAADGSTTYQCKLKRKRGSFTYYISGFTNASKSLYAVRFYGLLSGDDKVSQSGTFPGESLIPATDKVNTLVSNYLPDGDAVYASQNLVNTNTDDLYNYSGSSSTTTRYAASPTYNPENKWIVYTEVSSIGSGFFYPRIEVGANYLVAKGTSSFTQTGSITDAPENYTSHLAQYESEQESLLDEYIGTDSSALTLDADLGYNLTLDIRGANPTIEDHSPVPGFRTVYWADAERYKTEKKTITYKSYDPNNPSATASLWSYLNRFGSETAETIAHSLPKYSSRRVTFSFQVVPLFYKRQAYELTFFVESTDFEDYKAMVPYHYSLTQAAEAEYETGDDDAQLAQARGLAAYLAQFQPGVTRRASDGAVFVGWSTSHSEDDLVTSVGMDDDTFSMPAFDSALVALWKPVQYTLRVFCDVRNSNPCLTNLYNAGAVARQSDYEEQTLTPPAGSTLADLQGWLWRPRYVATADANGNPLTYRFGSWRQLSGSPPTMNSDIDMRPYWRADVLDVRYHPGLVDDSGNPTGPQGTGTMKARFVYVRGAYPVLQNYQYTPPEGYWFAGWRDNEGHTVYANDLAVEYDDDGNFEQLGILADRDLYAMWIRVPATSITYHSNWPTESGLTEVSVTTEQIQRNTLTDVAQVDSTWRAQAASVKLGFLGWSDTPDGPVKYLPAATTNPVLDGVNRVIVNDRHLNDLYAIWGESTATTFYVKKVGEQVGEVSDTTLDPDGDPDLKLLDGAQFALFTDEDGTPGTQLDDAVSAVQLQELTEDRWVDSAQFTITADDGSYFLVETTAPMGYDLLAEPISIQIADGQIQFDAADFGDTVTVDQRTVRLKADTSSTGDQAYVIQVKDATSATLPFSGGPGWIVFCLVGLAGLAAGFATRYYVPEKLNTDK